MERLLFSNHCLTVTRLLFIALVFSANSKLQGEETKALSFSGDKIQQVRNILSDKCFSCHGPDEKKRKGKLRLDSKTDAYAIRDDGFPILPGKPQESLIYARMTSSEKDEVMPPPNAGKSLNPQEKELMRDWISATCAAPSQRFCSSSSATCRCASAPATSPSPSPAPRWMCSGAAAGWK